MRISDWSSDVCSSDLHRTGPAQDIALNGTKVGQVWGEDALHLAGILNAFFELGLENRALAAESLDKYRELSMLYNVSEKLDRKRVVEGKSVSVRRDLGGRRSMKKKKYYKVGNI